MYLNALLVYLSDTRLYLSLGTPNPNRNTVHSANEGVALSISSLDSFQESP